MIEDCPERRLWRAVLHRAILDARMDDDNGISPEDCARARAFLLRDRHSFDPVASAAGFDPDWLHEQIREMI